MAVHRSFTQHYAVLKKTQMLQQKGAQIYTLDKTFQVIMFVFESSLIQKTWP